MKPAGRTPDAGGGVRRRLPKRRDVSADDAFSPKFLAGTTLTERDVAEIEAVLAQRDDLIEQVRANRPVPTMGYVRQTGAVTGRFADGWCGPELTFSVSAERAVSAIEVRFVAPDGLPAGTRATLDLDGVPIAETEAVPGMVTFRGEAMIFAGTIGAVRLAVSASANQAALGISTDSRDLGILPECFTFEG
jgi:hypothetical protein